MEIHPDRPAKIVHYPENALGSGVPRWLKYLRIVSILSPLVLGLINQAIDPDVNPISDAPEISLGPVLELVENATK